MISKQRIAESFSRASQHYDQQAQFQRDVGEQLMSLVPEPAAFSTRRRVMDLGSGTGTFLKPLLHKTRAEQLLAVDLAQGMNCFARQQLNFPEQIYWLTADAEQLPLADASVDLVFSNLSLQWCYQLDRLADSLARVLPPGGQLWFSSLNPGTLVELEQAWQSVDEYRHVNQFAEPEQVIRAFEKAGLNLALHRQQTQVLEFDQPMDVMRQLKGIGAHNLNDEARHGLTGAGRLMQLNKAYQSFRLPNGQYPATYHISYYGFTRPIVS